MSGHSKWASIKHKKGAVDAKRGKLFSRIAKELTVAAKIGGGDPDNNPRLRQAMQAAKAANMPSANIERAVKRGTGEIGGVNYEDVRYEAYAPGGVAVLVEILTDNKNRAAADIRSIFNRKGGSMAGAGSVAWIFDKRGLFRVSRDKADEEALFLLATDAGADDFRTEADAYEIISSIENFESIKKVLDENNIECEMATITYIPRNTVRVDGKEAHQVLELINTLEDHEDVQNVYANFDIPDEILTELS